MGGKKKGGGKKKKADGGDNDTKVEQKRIIDEIHNACNIENLTKQTIDEEGEESKPRTIEDYPLK